MRRRLYMAVWKPGAGVQVEERPAWVAAPGTVRVRVDDGTITSVTGFHRSEYRAEVLVMREVRDLLTGPTHA